MNPANELLFTVSDLINDIEVGPKHVPLALLGEFQRDVKEFLSGSGRDIDSRQIIISVEDGSLAFVATGLLAATSLWVDINHLQSGDSLSLVDPKRSSVIERWQNTALSNSNRRYLIADREAKIYFRVDSSTDHRKSDGTWVSVEKYLDGTVINMGGKKDANVHLDVEGMGIVTIAAPHDILEKEEKNLLYRSTVVRVTAQENLLTGERRNYRLLSFQTYQPNYDDEEFRLMVERGSKAWADVPDNWIEKLRGGGI